MKTPNMKNPEGHGILFIYSGVQDYLASTFIGCGFHAREHLSRFRNKGFRWNWQAKKITFAEVCREATPCSK
jgi:hypothetical protein